MITQPAMPAPILTLNGIMVSGDQNASTKAAAMNISAAPYMMRTAGRAASTSAARRERLAGAITAMPSLRPAAPASTIAVSSSDECPETHDQAEQLKPA